RYLKFYQQFTDRGLEQEEAKLRKDDPGGMNVTTQYRMEAIDRVRALRQGPGGPIDERTGLPASPSPRGPASSSQHQPQGLEEHTRFLEQYRPLSSKELQAEATRVLKADPFTRQTETNFRLSALNELMSDHKGAKPHGDLVNEDTLKQYRNEVKDWSTAKLLE